MKVSRPGPRPRRQNPQTLRNAAVSVTGKHSIECLLCAALNPSIGDGAAESPLAARVVRGSSDKLGVRRIVEDEELLLFLDRFLVVMSRPMVLLLIARISRRRRLFFLSFSWVGTRKRRGEGRLPCPALPCEVEWKLGREDGREEGGGRWLKEEGQGTEPGDLGRPSESDGWIPSDEFAFDYSFSFLWGNMPSFNSFR
jgi:hypothetical protein